MTHDPRRLTDWLREGQEMTKEQATLALQIVDPGAVNPVAICNELALALSKCNSHTYAKRNPALRLIVHHLAEMFHVGYLAHEEWAGLMDEVKEKAS